MVATPKNRRASDKEQLDAVTRMRELSEWIKETHEVKTAWEAEQELRACQAESKKAAQVLGRVLGYPMYVDEPKRFPSATEADGVNTGGVGLVRLAAQAAVLIRSYRETLEAVQAEEEA